ncbi:MAG TPA: ABC transporter permease [Fimbriimonadaceae bacterium]|nr:ABC transporter permease [Fimbriimonadaceae bacterium]
MRELGKDWVQLGARVSRKRAVSRLHPLSPAVFLVRNLGKTIPLTLVIMLSVMLVAGVIALIDSIPYSIRTIYAYTKESLGVSPRGDSTHMPAILSTIREGTPVEIDRIITCRVSGSEVHSIVGKWPFVVLGLGQADMSYFLQHQGVTSVVGRYPRQGQPEAIVSAPVARNLGLHLGSILQGPENQDSYSQKNVIVVGIAQTTRWLMVDPIEYQRLYHFPPVDLAMVFAKNRADQPKLDAWAEKRFKGERAQLFTYAKIDEDTRNMFETLFKIIDIVIGLLVVVITLMMAMLINIYQGQRLVEFGLLQAIGYTKRRLVGRTLLENILVVIFGWIMGIFCALGLLIVVRALFIEPHAYALDVYDQGPYRYTIPIPLTIMLVACGTILLRFRRFDPVAVVERRIV